VLEADPTVGRRERKPDTEGGHGGTVAGDARRSVFLAAVTVIGGVGVLHLGRNLRLRSRAAVSAVTLAPASLLPAAAAELVLLAGKRRTAATVGAATLACCAAAHVPAYRRTPRSALRGHRSQVELTVMTANLLYGMADPDALTRTVERHDVDVLCVQEVHGQALDALAARLADRLPHRLVLPGTRGGGSGIFSRFPLADRRYPSGFGFPPVMADVLVPITLRRDGGPRTRTISVLSFHGKAPLGNGGTRPWSQDLAHVRRLMTDHHGSLIVAGDFNATREHRQFRDLLAGGFTDAAQDAGAGLLPTYPAKPGNVPLGCLDHVLLGRGLVGLDVRTRSQPGSDHRAVIARIGTE